MTAKQKRRFSMKTQITLQERLRDLRFERHLRLEDLSRQTGISTSALSSYENDDYKEINHGSLIKLARFYEVSVDYLLCLSEKQKSPGRRAFLPAPE